MRRVPQGGGGGCGGHGGGGRRVLRRVVRVARPRAALGLACGGGELALEQGDGPAAAAAASAAAGGMQVRGDTERADAECAALAGWAARARHRHDEGGRHAERDEEVLAVMMMLRQGRSRPRGVFDD